MKHGIIAVLISCFPFACLNAQENIQETEKPDTLVVSLNDALKIALSESPTIKVADKEIDRVRYAKKETIGGLLPTVSLSAAYQRAIKKQKMYMDMDMSGMFTDIFPPGVMQDWMSRGIDLSPAPADPNATSGDGAIEIGRDNTFTGGVSATLPLIAPALWSSVNLSELQLELTMESARASKISLVNQVSKAYYGVLMAQDSYEVIKRTYDNSVENARIVKSKYEQGTVSEFEWIRADVQARNTFTNVVSAESGVNLSILQLKMLMGIDMYTEMRVVGNLSDFETNMYADVMLIDTTTLNNNTDLIQFDIQTKQLEQSLRVNRNSALPTLGLSFDFNYMSMVNDESTFSKDHNWFPNSNLSLALNIPLFQGATKINKNKQIKVQIEEMELNRLNLERSLQLQVITYMDNIKKSLQKIESDKESMKQAEKAMTISQKMYDVGMATYLDVTNSELAYIQAGLAYNQSIYDYLSNKADLEKILGDAYNK